MKLNRREIIGTGTYLCEFHIVVEPVGALLCIIKTDGSAARQPHFYLSTTELYLERTSLFTHRNNHEKGNKASSSKVYTYIEQNSMQALWG